MTVLWKSEEIYDTLNTPNIGNWTANGVSINSRKINPNDIFVALKGPRFDGHNFISDAFRAGASACIVEKNIDTVLDNHGNNKLVVVQNTKNALTAIAKKARDRVNSQIIAITGSVGKTTTKDILKYVLSRQNPTHATYGNYNNHIGVPLSLARMPEDTYYGVFEIGMNKKGEIAPLSCLVKPNIALITSVDAAHLGAFSSISEIALEKANIFEGLQKNKKAIIPADSHYYTELSQNAQIFGAQSILSFGTREGSDYRLLDTVLDHFGSKITANIRGKLINYKLKLRGQHMALNSLAVLAAVDLIGANVEQAAKDLLDILPTPGRGWKSIIKYKQGSFSIIDESYNASPISMLAMINTMALEPIENRKILVLGDMLELGKSSRRLHEELAVPIKKARVHYVFTAGQNMKYLNSILPPNVKKTHASDSAALATALKNFVKPGDILAIKGSAGSKMSCVVDALKDL